MKARDHLRETIDRQGLRYDWVASMVGMSKFEFSKLLARRRGVDVKTAGEIAALLGVPVFFAFELPDGKQDSHMATEDDSQPLEPQELAS